MLLFCWVLLLLFNGEREEIPIRWRQQTINYTCINNCSVMAQGIAAGVDWYSELNDFHNFPALNIQREFHFFYSRTPHRNKWQRATMMTRSEEGKLNNISHVNWWQLLLIVHTRRFRCICWSIILWLPFNFSCNQLSRTVTKRDVNSSVEMKHLHAPNLLPVF